jgi:hypothetical protein
MPTRNIPFFVILPPSSLLKFMIGHSLMMYQRIVNEMRKGSFWKDVVK